VARVLGGEPADVLLSDPPYDVAYEGGTADRLTIANDDLSPHDSQQFLVSAPYRPPTGSVRTGPAEPRSPESCSRETSRSRENVAFVSRSRSSM
jgi:hypothetical protein